MIREKNGSITKPYRSAAFSCSTCKFRASSEQVQSVEVANSDGRWAMTRNQEVNKSRSFLGRLLIDLIDLIEIIRHQALSLFGFLDRFVNSFSSCRPSIEYPYPYILLTKLTRPNLVQRVLLALALVLTAYCFNLVTVGSGALASPSRTELLCI